MKASRNCSIVVTVSRTITSPVRLDPTYSYVVRRPRQNRCSGLVVEAAALEQLRALLCAHLHVSRGEQKYLVGDALHAAVERVGESAREVDQAFGELGVGVLEVEDDRNRVLELVGDL